MHSLSDKTMIKSARSKMAGKWIAGAINPAHAGLLHQELHVPQGQKIPAAKLAKAAKGNSALAKRARLAETLRSFHRR